MRWFVAMLLFVTSATATAQTAPKPPPAVGALLPLSGKFGKVGKNLLQSLELAAAEVNVRIVVVDSASKTGLPAAFKKLESANVAAIVGPIGRATSEQAVALAHRAQVPIFPLSSELEVQNRSPFAFRFRPAPEEQAEAIAAFAYQDLELRKFGVLFPQTAYGSKSAAAFVARVKALGGKVVAIGSYPADITDFKDPLLELVGRSMFLGKKRRVGKRRANKNGYVRLRGRKTIDFDALFIPDFADRVARLLPFLPLVGLQNGESYEGRAVQLLGLSGWQGKTMEFSGAVAAGALITDTFTGVTDGGRSEEFVRTFENATGRPPEDLDAEAFDLVWMIGKRVPRGVGVDVARTKLVGALPVRQSWEGVTGVMQFTPSGAPVRQFNIYRFDDGGFVAPAF